MKTNKPGSIPLLERLPGAQKDALFRWLTEEHLTYAQAQARLRAEFDVKTTAASLSAFWHSVCFPRRAVELMGTQASAVRGKVLVEIKIRALEDSGLSVSIVGGEVGSSVESESGDGVTTFRVRALLPGASIAAPSPRRVG